MENEIELNESMKKEEIEELLQENTRKFKELLKLKDSGQNTEGEISKNKEEWIDLSNKLNELDEPKPKERVKKGNGNGNSNGERHEKRRIRFEFIPTQEFYKSLGWICANAEVIIHSILATHEDKFVERYLRVKGHDVPVEYDLQENVTSTHWGDELRVVTNCLPRWNLDTGNKNFEQSHVCSKLEHTWTIYSNSFVWWLLNNGFDFVENQDVEAIRSNVPEIYRESFDLGSQIHDKITQTKWM